MQLADHISLFYNINSISIAISTIWLFSQLLKCCDHTFVFNHIRYF
uniref:Uncharacterized protein n=1 Tax=Anguilla anguilla TaxID=7936 RepID=A0A0E9X9W3_ANGAN